MYSPWLVTSCNCPANGKKAWIPALAVGEDDTIGADMSAPARTVIMRPKAPLGRSLNRYGQAPEFKTPTPAIAARQEFPYTFLSQPHTGFR
jgi:hypothetical protein